MKTTTDGAHRQNFDLENAIAEQFDNVCERRKLKKAAVMREAVLAFIALDAKAAGRRLPRLDFVTDPEWSNENDFTRGTSGARPGDVIATGKTKDGKQIRFKKTGFQ